MDTTTKILAASAALVIGTTGLMVPVAQAATTAKTYSSCDSLHRKYPSGVAKNKKAARRAVRDGYSWPAYGSRARAVYWANYSNLDRDRDGVACES